MQIRILHGGQVASVVGVNETGPVVELSTPPVCKGVIFDRPQQYRWDEVEDGQALKDACLGPQQ